jgi:glutathione S-transferase
MFSRYMGKTANEKVIAEHAAKLDAKLDAYEAILSKQKYLAGDVRLQHSCSRLPPD